MIDEQARPLRGAAVYNPHLLSKDELVELFQARHALLDRLVDDLRSTPTDRPPQHHLVIGQRGMGKTMLLHRLAYAIEDDPQLSPRWIPLTFPEEQYNVAHLSDFWLNCLDALSDRLERTCERDASTELDERIEGLRKIPEKSRSREALATLLDAARRLGRRVALLVDNVELVVDRISEKEEWAFRDALSHESGLVFIGASAAAGEVTYDHGRAFYDFFQVHELCGLSLDETRGLLLHYAEVWSEPGVAEIVERHHARLRTLHALTGGNPRTIVLLFNVLARGIGGDVRTDLEQLLDQCTPLYKARFEALPEQAQRVVHALAIHWDPISAGELAREMRLRVNLVSAQLNRLVQQGVVEKVLYHPPTKTGFQIAERFFNIWYLMRASRRVRRRLIWLVEFLRLYYSREELEEHARQHMNSGDEVRDAGRVAHAEMAFALADALRDDSWSPALEDIGLRKLVESPLLRERLAELLDLGHAGLVLRWRADYLIRYQALRESIDRCPPAVSSTLRRQLVITPRISLAQKEALASTVVNMSPADLALLEMKLDLDAFLARQKLDLPAQESIESLRRAVESGDMVAYDDVRGALSTERRRAVSGLALIAVAFRAIRFLTFARLDAPARLVGVELPEGRPDPEDLVIAIVFLGWLLAVEGSGSVITWIEGLGERWRPLREAVEAATSDRSRLRRLAPEIRQLAEEILEGFGEVKRLLQAKSDNRPAG